MPGIKTDDNKWNVEGHPHRLIQISEGELRLLADLFEEDEKDYLCARLPAIHVREMLNVLRCFSSQNVYFSDLKKKDELTVQYLWHETYAQEDGTIKEKVSFPDEWKNMIYTGPVVGVANPIYKTPRAESVGKADYDSIPLANINSSYIPRTKYVVECSWDEYLKRCPKTAWGTNYISEYKLLSRKMLNVQQERTLMTCIAPKQAGHTNGLTGVAFKDARVLAIAAGLFASVPYDYFIKALKKSNFYEDTMCRLPLIDNEYADELIVRTLLLNCVGNQYSELWKEVMSKVDITSLSWMKRDYRLKNHLVNKKYEFSEIITNDFERRQALVEIDVLVAMMLGMTLEQLKAIYRIQFSVLKMYEGDTWYDAEGKIVFTNNRSMVGVGLDRSTWERIKNIDAFYECECVNDVYKDKDGTEQIIYKPPYSKCDREKDYEEVWNNFLENFN